MLQGMSKDEITKLQHVLIGAPADEELSPAQFRQLEDEIWKVLKTADINSMAYHVAIEFLEQLD